MNQVRNVQTAAPISRKEIMANVRNWQRTQRLRHVAKERRSFNSGFNCVGDQLTKTQKQNDHTQM